MFIVLWKENGKTHWVKFSNRPDAQKFCDDLFNEGFILGDVIPLGV